MHDSLTYKRISKNEKNKALLKIFGKTGIRSLKTNFKIVDSAENDIKWFYE